MFLEFLIVISERKITVYLLWNYEFLQKLRPGKNTSHVYFPVSVLWTTVHLNHVLCDRRVKGLNEDEQFRNAIDVFDRCGLHRQKYITHSCSFLSCGCKLTSYVYLNTFMYIIICLCLLVLSSGVLIFHDMALTFVILTLNQRMATTLSSLHLSCLYHYKKYFVRRPIFRKNRSKLIF